MLRAAYHMHTRAKPPSSIAATCIDAIAAVQLVCWANFRSRTRQGPPCTARRMHACMHGCGVLVCTACVCSCFAHVRPCAQGRCRRCTPGSGVTFDSVLRFFCLDGTHTLGYDVAKAKRCAIPACRLSHRHRTRTSQRGRAAVTDPHRVRMQVQMQQYMDSRHMHTVNGGHTRPSRSLTKQKRRPGMCASTGPGGGVGVNVECAVSSTAISQLDLDNFG